ncbi:MAG: hypothetical protein KAT06_11075 [Gammaproteobacteria bacterium]|nr:hypothetical protein [Gammaproteobacteria bacterium]
MDFELTRKENDELLLSQVASIKTGENIQALIPFAKAYLGMFYVIDSELAPKEKIKLLANAELTESVFAGFLASLKKPDLPSVAEIGHAAASKKEFAEGYVILAGLDLVAKKSLGNVNDLDVDLIEKAIAFHFSNNSGYSDIWFEYLFSEHKEKVLPAISQYWVAMLKNKTTYLPGKNLVLGDRPDIEVIQYCILSLLGSWTQCKAKTLSQLLYLAFKFSEINDFLIVCEHALEHDEILNEKTRLYWLTAAYLISPDKYFARLSDYVGRVKLKVMLLLDFVVLLSKEHVLNIKMSNKVVIQILRMVAPIFPPQHHVYGALGELDINSKNVMVLFYYLACSKDKDVGNEIKILRKARVMKIYSGVIDNLLELHVRKNNEQNFILPNFDEYLATLVKDNCLQGRSNKFDLR